MIKNDQRRTGGGPPVNLVLTNEEESIVGMIGSTLTDGHQNILESDTTFDRDTVEVLDDILVDHNYVGNQISVKSEIRNLPSTSNTPVNPEVKPKRKKIVRVERLNNSIEAAQNLAVQTEQFNRQSGEYQKRKLELYEKDIEAKNRIAIALEKIAASFN